MGVPGRVDLAWARDVIKHACEELTKEDQLASLRAAIADEASARHPVAVETVLSRIRRIEDSDLEWETDTSDPEF